MLKFRLFGDLSGGILGAYRVGQEQNRDFVDVSGLNVGLRFLKWQLDA